MAEKEIPPTAAPRSVFDLLKLWAFHLEIPWETVLDKANIKNRATPWRMDQGTAGLETAKKIEKYLAQAEAARALGTGSPARRVIDQLPEWNAIGARLGYLDAATFERMLERLRVILDGLEEEYELHPTHIQGYEKESYKRKKT